MLLVNLIFSLPLKWGPQFELDHLELFAGDCSVTKGEVKVPNPVLEGLGFRAML